MKTLYYYREDGSLIGGFAGSEPKEAFSGHTELAPADARQRWNGTAWTPDAEELPRPDAEVTDPVQKLAAFLQANPDVAALVNEN